ncbi:hypothetical protein [Adhaeribacter rhizoryzae]|uniref:Lipocalin-like domain-containing protein n=1 Tax=Adhaeribacter rhizoryzae TaxID=2607907 RepID=A0A5M6D5G7_9BACT|nr:hypothetical protein [Adhaeribacter rhizoryzae]KAA5541996.1 hypothetical protein F0145_19610 [Adhaeribacter rhizoryzae]
MKNFSVAVATGYTVMTFLIAAGGAGCSGQTDTASKPSGSAETAKEEPNDDTRDYAENFVGEWKSVESEERNHMVFTRNGENFIMKEGDKTVPAVYDKESKVIKINAGVPFDVMYLENENMLLVTGGGKYTKVTRATEK